MEITFRKKGLYLSKVDLWYMPVTPGLGRLRQEGLELEASLGYIVSKQANRDVHCDTTPIGSAGILDSVPSPLPSVIQWKGLLSSWNSFEERTKTWGVFGFQNYMSRNFISSRNVKTKIYQ